MVWCVCAVGIRMVGPKSSWIREDTDCSEGGSVLMQFDWGEGHAQNSKGIVNKISVGLW